MKAVQPTTQLGVAGAYSLKEMEHPGLLAASGQRMVGPPSKYLITGIDTFNPYRVRYATSCLNTAR